MDLLQVALTGPNGNQAIFRGYEDFRCVGPSINAHIVAVPWAGHAENSVSSGE
jgi:hypothetical protein